MEPFAYALPLGFNPTGGQELTICFTVIAGDGVNPPFGLPELLFAWDPTQPVATNVANLKAAILNEAASSNLGIETSNVNILMAVS